MIRVFFLNILVALLLYITDPGVVCDEAIGVYITSEQLGFLEPCGCSEPQLGGMPRLKSFMEDKRVRHNTTTLLSNGDLLEPKALYSPLKMETLIEAMNQVGYQVLNVGEKELYWRYDELQIWMAMSQFKWISLNVKYQDQPIFESFVTLNQYINVTGILASEPNVGEWNIQDPQDSLIGFYNNLADNEKNKFWIILFHGAISKFKQVSVPFKNFVVITAHTGDDPYVEQFNNYLEIAPGIKGRYIAELFIDDKIFNYPLHKKSVTFIDLNPSFKNHPAIENLIKAYLVSLKEEKIAQKMANQILLKNQFISAQQCSVCHIKEYEIWQSTKHAHAFDVLLKKERTQDPECLMCHTTGYTYQSGFTDSVSSSGLTNVSCESCHGPGSEHAKAPLVKGNIIRANSETCLKCHDIDNSPHFDFGQYYPKIRHEGLTKITKTDE